MCHLPGMNTRPLCLLAYNMDEMAQIQDTPPQWDKRPRHLPPSLDSAPQLVPLSPASQFPFLQIHIIFSFLSFFSNSLLTPHPSPDTYHIVTPNPSRRCVQLSPPLHQCMPDRASKLPNAMVTSSISPHSLPGPCFILASMQHPLLSSSHLITGSLLIS
jgi:hypothetical protein